MSKQKFMIYLLTTTLVLPTFTSSVAQAEETTKQTKTSESNNEDSTSTSETTRTESNETPSSEDPTSDSSDNNKSKTLSQKKVNQTQFQMKMPLLILNHHQHIRKIIVHLILKMKTRIIHHYLYLT